MNFELSSIYQYLQSLLASNQFLQGGVFIAALTAIYYQAKALPIMLLNKLKYIATYTVYFDDSTELYATFTEWFGKNYPKKFRNVEARFYYDDRLFHNNGSSNEPATVESSSHRRQKKKSSLTIRKFQYSDNNIIFYNNRLIYIRKTREKMENARESNFAFLNSYSISGLFARQAIDALLADMREIKLSEIENNDLRVGIANEGGGFEWKSLEIVKSLKHLFFEGKNELIADLEAFLKRKLFYRNKGINFKRNYLLYGPGGTGKTTCAMAIAKYLAYDLVVVNLASIKDDIALQRMGNNIAKNTVVLLEDIDCILNQRDVSNDKLNFSTVLNFLDGLYAPSDVIFIMTTNHPEVLDAALIRKGRVDYSLKIDFPCIREIEDFMTDFFETQVDLPLFTGRARVGMAEIQEICLRATSFDAARREVMKTFTGIDEARKFKIEEISSSASIAEMNEYTMKL